MKFVPLNENIEYSEDIPEQKSEGHLIICEVASRLQELDSVHSSIGNTICPSVRFLTRLTAIQRRSMRAYRLVLDILSSQDSLSHSLEALAQRHLNAQGEPSKRQAWLQNTQKDIETIEELYPEIGYAMKEIMTRRGEGKESN